MKVVWLLNHYAVEPSGSGGTRHYSLAKHAARHGYQIILIGASVEHLTGRQRLATGESKRLEESDGVTFLWLKTGRYKGNGIGRIRNMLEYSWRVLRRSSTVDLPDPNIVIGSSVHPLAALAGQKIAHRYRVPFVFEIRDLWPETLIQMGRVSRGGLAAIVLRRLERWLCDKAERIVVLLPRAHEYLKRYDISAEKVVWIPNGADPDESPYVSPEPKDPITLMYLGAHGTANGLDAILRAIEEYNRQPGGGRIHFRFVGEGPEKKRLQLVATSLGISDSVSFEPAVPRRQVPELAAEADAFLLNVRDLELYRYGFSFNKLFDYMAAGRPVVFAGCADDNPIAAAQAGFVVGADDVEGMAAAFFELVSLSFDARREMGLRGRRYLEAHFSSRVLAERLVRCLDALGD